MRTYRTNYSGGCKKFLVGSIGRVANPPPLRCGICNRTVLRRVNRSAVVARRCMRNRMIYCGSGRFYILCDSAYHQSYSLTLTISESKLGAKRGVYIGATLDFKVLKRHFMMRNMWTSQATHTSRPHLFLSAPLAPH